MSDDNYDPLDLRGQAEAKVDKETRARLLRETEDADLKWLLSSKRGRRVIWRLLDQSGVFRAVFHTNAMQMSFNEGNRNFGLRMLSLIQASCPELYSVMQRENSNGGRNADGPGSRNNQ